MPDLGWATRIVQEPAGFNALMLTGRDTWIRLHAHDYSWHEVDHKGWQRRLALLELRLDLQRVATTATDTLVTTWIARGTLEDDLGARTVRAAARACQVQAEAMADGAPPSRERIAPLVTDLPADEQRAVLEASRFQQRIWETDDHQPLKAHIQRRHIDGLWMFGPDRPTSSTFVDLYKEPSADEEAGRTWQDPCLAWHGMYALYKTDHPRDGLAAAAPDALSTTLFSARGVDPTQLGLSVDVPDVDDPEAAREEVRRMDHILDGTRALLEAQADPDGLAVLQQVRPLAHLRQDVLVDRARRDLRAGHHRRAYATLLLARDVTEREIGVANGPALFALLAEANLRAGRSREALDALQPLVARFPETAATREIVSDLVVLEGMDRTGDSKEH